MDENKRKIQQMQQTVDNMKRFFPEERPLEQQQVEAEEEDNMIVRALKGALEKLKNMDNEPVPLEYEANESPEGVLEQPFSEGMKAVEERENLMKKLFPEGGNR